MKSRIPKVGILDKQFKKISSLIKVCPCVQISVVNGHKGLEISSESGTTTGKIRIDKSGVTTMCLARPVKVLKCDGMWVEIEDSGARHRAYSALLANEEVAVGDYLLVHGELAIHKLPTDEALKIIALIETLDQH